MESSLQLTKVIAVAAILVNLSLMEASNFVENRNTICGKFLARFPALREFVASFSASKKRFRLFQRCINAGLTVLSFFPFNLGFVALNVAMFGSSFVTRENLARSPFKFVRFCYFSWLKYIGLLVLPIPLACLVFVAGEVPSQSWWSQSLSLYGSYCILTAFFGLMAGFCGKASSLYTLGYIQGCTLMAYGAYLGGPGLYPFMIMEIGLAFVFVFFLLERRRIAGARNVGTSP